MCVCIVCVCVCVCVCGREEGRTFGPAKIQNLKFCQVATDWKKRGGGKKKGGKKKQNLKLCQVATDCHKKGEKRKKAEKEQKTLKKHIVSSLQTATKGPKEGERESRGVRGRGRGGVGGGEGESVREGGREGEVRLTCIGACKNEGNSLV